MSNKPYILGQVVARGGMAEVYRGLHVGQDGFRRLVAIKRILPHHAQNAEFTEMFKDEAHIGQRLQHANIVKVEGFDIIDGSASIIMEFVDGADLRSLLSAIENKRPTAGIRHFLPNALCAYIIAEAARGLHYAHTRRDDITGKPLNIVHRDISPQNLLISWEGDVKITDFGIAAADRDFKQTETKAGIVKGKYSYMSPEQISGKKCDARTDVFALSVVLWEMLAMRRLFTADNEIDVIEMVRHCKIHGRLKDFNPNVNEELEAIVMRGITKDPRKRFESMESLEKTLRAYLAKHHSATTGTDLNSYIKDALSERREASQEEMRKILTSTQLPTAAANSSTSKQSRELSMDDATEAPATLMVGRTRTNIGTNIGTPRTAAVTGSPFSSRQRQQSLQHDRLRNTPHSPRNRNSKIQSAPNSKHFIMLITMLTLAIFAGAFFKNYRNAAKQSLMLTIRSTPSPVRIKINERDHAGGRFVASPAKIKLDPGLNSIEISRPGYTTEKRLINTNDGIPKQPPSLRLKATEVFSPVRIQYKGTEPVLVSVNDGFFKTQMSPSLNIAQVQDIAHAEASYLVVINSEKRTILRCNFTPLNSSERRPLIVTITTQAAGCEVSGPGKGDH